MKLFSKFLIVLLLLIPVALRGQNYGDHIVADGTTTNQYVPVWGNYADNYLRCQTIYPAEMLASLQGATVTHLIYYIQQAATSEWNANFEVRVGVTTATQLSGFDDSTSLSLVYTGPLSGRGSTMEVVLDTPFLYSGGNLLVEFINNQKGSYSQIYFYGISSSGSSSSGRNGSSVSSISGQARDFIPKVNFYALNTSCVAPATVTLRKVSDSYVSLSWSHSATASSYLVQCGDRSFRTLDTLCVVDSLSPSSDYQIFVRSLCDNGDTSDAVSLSVHTICAPFVISDSTFFFEDFESGIGECWDNFHLDGPGDRLWTINTTMHHSGSQSVCMPNQSGTTRMMLVSPPILVPTANAFQLSCWIYKVSTIPQSHLSHTNEGIRIWANTTPDTLGATQLLYYHRISDVENVDGFYLCEIPIPLADTIYLLFEGISQFGGYMYVDDIEVAPTKSCPRPFDVVSHGTLSSRIGFSWSDTASSGRWQVHYKLRNAEVWTLDTTIFTVKHAVLSGLQPQSDYELQVRGICANSDTTSWSNSLYFSTSCLELTSSDFPYEDDFESYASGASAGIDACWYKNCNSATPYPYPASEAAINGARGFEFYAFHPATASQNFVYSYAVMPPISDSVDITSLSLDFMLKRHGATSYNYTTNVQVGVMSNPQDVSTFQVFSDIDLYGMDPDSIAKITVNFATMPLELTQSRYIAFMCPVPQLYGGELCHNYVYMDDVSLYFSPLCYPPDNVSFQNITATTASASFETMGTRVQVRMRPTFDTSWTYLDTSAANSTIQQFDNLEPNTSYYVQLRSFCNVDSASLMSSEWSSSYTFSTLCGLPFEEHFIGQGIPTNWHNGTDQTSPFSVGWTKSTIMGNSMKSNIYSVGSSWLVTPTVDLASDTNAVLSFRLAVTDFNSANQPGVNEPDTDDVFKVMVSTDGGASFPSDQTITWGVGTASDYDFSALDNHFSSFLIPLSEYAQGSVTIAFCTQSAREGSDFDVHLADVMVYAPTPCPRPANTQVSRVADHSVSLSCSAESVVQLRYRPYGTSNWIIIDSGFDYQSSIVSYQLTNLLPTTEYAVQVRTVCPPDTSITTAMPTVSDWVDFPVFTTLCAAENLPYQPDFSTTVPDCWQLATAQYQPDTLVDLLPTTSGWDVSSRLISPSHLAVNIYGVGCRYWAVTPILTITHPSQISFDAALTAFGTSNRPSSVGADDRFLVLATFDDGLTWQTIATFDSTSQSNDPTVYKLSSLTNVPKHYEIDIPFLSNQYTVRLALYVESSASNSDNDLHLGNLIVSRSILPHDTLQFAVSNAALSDYPKSGVPYTVSGAADTGNYSAAVTFALPASEHINGVGPFSPIVISGQLSNGGTLLPILKTTILQISKSDTAIDIKSNLIDADTLCYHFNFHYAIPLVSVTLLCDSLQGAISILDSQFSILNSQFSARLGDTIILAAVPRTATCYRFVAWGDGDTSDVRQVFLVSDTSFTATFGSTLVYDVDTVGEACNSYVWFDSIYTLSGSYTYQSQPLNGCDSVATLDLTIHYDSFDTIVDAVCDSLYWLLADTTIFQSGGYDFHLTNGFGCDSSVTLQLTVNSSVIDSVAIEISNAELPYTYNNIVLDTFGVYPFHFSTVEGCDSLVVFSLRHLLQINNSTTQQSGVLTVSPNPTQGRLAVLHPQFEYCELYDLSGRKLLYSREAEIDLSQLSAAVYTLRIVTSQGTYLRKVVKLER